MAIDYLEHVRAMYPDVEPGENPKADELMSRLADAMQLTDICKRHLDKEGQVLVQSRGTYTIMKENPYAKQYAVNHKLIISTMRAMESICGESLAGKDELIRFLEADDE